MHGCLLCCQGVQRCRRINHLEAWGRASMLTIFALPKPFRDQIGIIQRNAIESWLRLPSCEVILFGDEEGTAETAAQFGLRHVPDVERSEYGTPLVNSLFHRAQALGNHDIIGYVNADIILTGDIVEAIHKMPPEPFLLIGKRWDLDVTQPLDYEDPDWEAKLRRRVKTDGVLHGHTALDYFVFRRGLYSDIPPFAIGRTSWDNWLVVRARSLGAVVVDASPVVTIIHQNHDYSHHPDGHKGIWEGPEAARNLMLLGGPNYVYGVLDSTHVLSANGLKAARSLRHLLRRLYRIPETHSQLFLIAKTARRLRPVAIKAMGAMARIRGMRTAAQSG